MTTVRSYRNSAAYNVGLAEMRAEGWVQTSVVEQRGGCLSFSGARIVVTYSRTRETATVAAERHAELGVRTGQCSFCGTAVKPTAWFCPTCGKQLR